MAANKIISVVGARPQFVKAAPVSRALAAAGMTEVIVDTGQHYDARLRRVFFEELGLAEPAYHLAVGSGTHAEQTAAGLLGLERALQDERPDWVLVYGDTNATLAGALAAAKLNLPVAHVEAGLRSYNRTMPEELNRVVTDHLSALLFCPSAAARANLAREGIVAGVFVVGDVMVDSLRWAAARPKPAILPVPPAPYTVATIHRAATTDDPSRLAEALACLSVVPYTVVFPMHPRTREMLRRTGPVPPNVQTCEPLSFVEMIHTVQGAELVLTDSGGLQKEAYLLGKPVITLREETEWTETLAGGWNRLVGTDAARTRAALHEPRTGSPDSTVYGDGQAAAQIVRVLQES